MKFNSKALWFILLFAVNLLIGCGDSKAESSHTQSPVVTESGNLCGQVALQKRPLLYCYEDRAGQISNSSREIPVIYYFHGLGGSVEDLFKNRWLVDALEKAYGSQLPVIVSLSLGNEGVMGDEANEIASSGLSQIEKAIAPQRSFRRLLVGGSMGGHNVLRLGAAQPERLGAIAALCPAVASFNGHHRGEVDAYIARHEPLFDRDYFEKALAVYKRELPTAEIWDRNSPIKMLESGIYKNIPIFYSVGIEDQLGFIEGGREFRDRALQAGVNVDYHEVHGPHCSADIPALLRFLKVNF